MADASPAVTGPLAEKVKLVVWDLDDTLWEGTLSEGEVKLDPAMAELVRTLNRRGIANSICSKNDLEPTRERLEAEGLWGEFVFPSISWSPKGPRLAELIEAMQLRAVNVLFIDDNIGNLQEALHYIPGLQAREPAIVTELLSLAQLKGKDDSGLTRLAQYKILERKAADREIDEGGNEEFLRSCAIRVEIREITEEPVERLTELINRSNQLNFTKSRVSEERLAEMLAEPGRETRCVRVEDRYGDYGVCGFYSTFAGELTDYVFSCRILHMGVEQWLYARLGMPRIEIVGDVAASLDRSEAVDWISLSDGQEATGTGAGSLPASRNSRVLLKGGCDLSMLHTFLAGSIRTEFTFPSSTGAEVHGEHTEVLRRSTKEQIERFGAVIDRLPFMERVAYNSRLIRAPNSVGTMIYSVLMDYTQGLYRLREDGDYVVPFGQHDQDATDPVNWAYLEKRYGDVGLDRSFLEWFAETFEFRGALGEEEFKENIRWLAGALPKGSRLILLNGVEIPFEHPRETDRHLHHVKMNRALEEVVRELPNTVVLDVRPLVRSDAELTENIRHYTRQVYVRVAEQLTVLAGDDLTVEERPFVAKMNRARRRLRRNVERAALKLQVR